MSAIAQHLERSFESFVDHQMPMPFFKGLAEYLEYLFTVPELKAVFREEMEERNELYRKAQKLEEKTLREIAGVKAELLQIIRKCGVDIKSFRRFNTWAIRGDLDILEEMEAHENGGIRGAGPLSRELERYLFDIAANLFGLGFKSEIEKFLVSPDELKNYYRRINGPSAYIVVGNEHGNFIFSETLPETYEVEGILKRERLLKPWGSFEMLYRFKQAYKNSADNKDPGYNFERPDAGEFGVGPEVSADDIVEITFIQGDFDNLIKLTYPQFAQNSPSTEKLRHLVFENFRSAVKTVHGRLMRTASEMEKGFSSKDYWVVRNDTGNYYFDGNKIHFTSPNANYVKIFIAVFSLLPHGGSITYPKITAHTKIAKKRAVQRALTGEKANFFRYVPAVKRTLNYDIPLFEASRDGKELKFNNKR